MSMRMWRSLDQNRVLIITLYSIIAVLVLINFLMWAGWREAPRDLTIHIPPDLSSIVTMKANDIPTPTIYGFAFYLWQVLGNWQENGATDFNKNINAYGPYITPAFKLELINQMMQLQAKGELQDRTRVIQGQVGAAYQSSNVIPLGNGAWEVDLTVRVTERIGNTILQDALILYPLRVVRFDVNRQTNPWGLALDGFITEPKRIQTFI